MMGSLLFYPLVLMAFTTAFVSGQDDHRVVEQKILETLLKPPYDRRIRPTTSGVNGTTGTVVKINMFIRAFDFIDDVNMQYSIQLTFRMQWNDHRLRYSHLNAPEKLKYLTLTTVSQTWIPDIFFSNEKSAYFHEMLVPNAFIRIYPYGDVLYSARLSMTLSCPMQLRNFPFDEQTCFMRMASYGYTTEDLIFKWKDEEPLQLTKHLDLPRFSLSKFITESCDSTTTTGTYSCLRMGFSLRREYAYYNSQIYLPCVMIVVIGWLTFWINRYEVCARIVALIATLLVMATLIGSFNDTVPKVSYTKASDVWTGVCFLFIFAALFQFIVVHYLTSRESLNLKSQPKDCKKARARNAVDGSPAEASNLLEVDGVRVNTGETDERENGVKKGRILRMRRYLSYQWLKKQPIGHQVDVLTRVLYPFAFFLFNLVYWPRYYEDEHEVE